MLLHCRRYWNLWVVLLCIGFAESQVLALEAEVKTKTNQSGEKVDDRYLLRYQFRPGETIRTKVVHQASVRTTIEGTNQTAKTVSVSVKTWRVVDIDAEGRVTFEHSVEYVDMKNDVTGARNGELR